MKKFMAYGVSALLAISMLATQIPVNAADNANEPPAYKKEQKMEVKKPGLMKKSETKTTTKKMEKKKTGVTGKACPVCPKCHNKKYPAKMHKKKGMVTGKACKCPVPKKYHHKKMKKPVVTGKACPVTKPSCPAGPCATENCNK